MNQLSENHKTVLEEKQKTNENNQQLQVTLFNLFYCHILMIDKVVIIFQLFKIFF